MNLFHHFFFGLKKKSWADSYHYFTCYTWQSISSGRTIISNHSFFADGLMIFFKALYFYLQSILCTNVRKCCTQTLDNSRFAHGFFTKIPSHVHQNARPCNISSQWWYPAIKPCHLYQSFFYENHYANLIIIQIFDAFLSNHIKILLA